jgi:hypothetical protein
MKVPLIVTELAAIPPPFSVALLFERMTVVPESSSGAAPKIAPPLPTDLLPFGRSGSASPKVS